MIESNSYWNHRYRQSDTPWDIGHVSPAIQRFLKSLDHKELSILIPGAGYGHEVMYAYSIGLKNVFFCEWSELAVDTFKKANPDFPEKQILCVDFFELEDQYDIIIEQTFFCALPLHKREAYVAKMHQLLKDNGRLCGLLFDGPFDRPGPPFGGTKEEYQALFQSCFTHVEMAITDFSHPARSGREFWFECNKGTV